MAKPTKRRRKKPAPPPPAWTVDKNGRWRDPKGRFASRAAVLRGPLSGTPEDVGMVLQEAATRVPRRGVKKQDYVVMGKFEDIGWRTLGAATDLKTSLAQAGDWLENQLGQEVGMYGRDPVLLEVEVKPVHKGKSKSLKRNKRKAKKGKK